MGWLDHMQNVSPIDAQLTEMRVGKYLNNKLFYNMDMSDS